MAPQAEAPPVERRGSPWRSHAFGVGISLDFAAPGLPPGESSHGLPEVELRLEDEAALEADWRPSEPQRLLEETFGADGPDRTIDFDEQRGYRLCARHFGTALISPAGSEVVCAPPPVAEWSWQRFLVGRVLPWTALLRGREVFHASAVRVGDEAVAFVAPTGGGKTSLAIQLALRGAGFITDDVLALERTETGVAAHPGAALVAVRDEEKNLLTDEQWAALGEELGTSGKTYIAMKREDGPLPLGAIYFLAPGEEGIETVGDDVDARDLLGSTFISSVSSPMRLTSLLEICAVMSTSVPAFRLRVPPRVGAAELAEEVLRHRDRASAA